jgi:ribosome-associated heat shock protein Hsp15
MTQNVRIDKYLWAVRIFKTRNLATEECKKAHVIISDVVVKPSRIVKQGETILVKFPPIIRFVVDGIIEKRVSAALAKTFVTEITPESEFEKLKLAHNNFVQRDRGTGRPTKKERRHIDKIQGDTL